MQTTYTITSGNGQLIVRDGETGEILGTVPSGITITERSDSTDVVAVLAAQDLLRGPVASVEHDRDTIHVVCDVLV